MTLGQTVIAEFVYDGDGNRVKKTENGETVRYNNPILRKAECEERSLPFIA